MHPRSDPPRTRSTTTTAPASIASTALASVVSSSSVPAPSLSPPQTSLTSHAITRHLAKVSQKARLDYLKFSSGIDGTLPAPASISTSSNTASSSSNISFPASLKRTFQEANSELQDRSNSDTLIQGQSLQSQNQSQSHSASGPRSKKPRQSSTPLAASLPSVVTRARFRAAESHHKQSQGIASFMRQSKTSTSQKRSNANTKVQSKAAVEMSSSGPQNISPDTLPVDSDKDGSGAGQSLSEVGGVIQEKKGEILSQDAGHSEKAREDGKKGENDQGNEDDGDEEDEEDEEDDDEEDEEEEDYENNHHPDQDGLFSSGGSMSGLVSGMSSRLKGILTNLRAYEDPSLQLIALQDLAVLLSVSTEDTLSGYISLDTFIKELVTLLRGTGDDDDNPDIMLLACRCLSNLMEAMPHSVGNVFYGGAIPVLCSKLIEIHYIDLAEQSLTVSVYNDGEPMLRYCPRQLHPNPHSAGQLLDTGKDFVRVPSGRGQGRRSWRSVDVPRFLLHQRPTDCCQNCCQLLSRDLTGQH